MLEQYIYKNRKKLRCGYTTGSCAAAAAKAAAQMLLGGQRTETVELVTPSGQKLLLDVEEILQEKERVSCAIRKDSGDDPDITNGILIFASVEKAEDGFRHPAVNGNPGRMRGFGKLSPPSGHQGAYEKRR